MSVYILNSLCKKCPYSAMKQCQYKKSFYKKLPVMEKQIKLVHKCVHYRNIFKKGQYVVIDLYNQELMTDGKWKYVIAHKNVPGIIKGTRGNKYIIELIEAYGLIRKKGGKRQSSQLRIFLECTRVAKSIRPLHFSPTGGQGFHALSTEQLANELQFN